MCLQPRHFKTKTQCDRIQFYFKDILYVCCCILFSSLVLSDQSHTKTNIYCVFVGVFFAASFRRSHGWKKTSPMSQCFVSTLPLPRASIWDGKTVIMKTSNSHPATGRARSCSFFTPTTMRTRTNRSTSSTSSTRSNSTSWWDADSNDWNWGSLPKLWGERAHPSVATLKFLWQLAVFFNSFSWASLMVLGVLKANISLAKANANGTGRVDLDLVRVGAETKGVLQWIFHLSWEPRLLSLETSRWLEIHVAQKIFGLLEMWPLKQMTWAVFASCMAYSISRLL